MHRKYELVVVHMNRLEDRNDLVPQGCSPLKELDPACTVVQQALSQILGLLQLKDLKLFGCLVRERVRDVVALLNRVFKLSSQPQ